MMNMIAVVAAVGRSDLLGSILHNAKEHFSGPEWACLVFLYVDEDIIAKEDPILQQRLQHLIAVDVALLIT